MMVEDEVILNSSSDDERHVFDKLSTETLGHIVSFCDFPSALRFSRSISRSLRQDLYKGGQFIWRDIFHRHHFSLPETTTAAVLHHHKTQQQHEKENENEQTHPTAAPPIDYLHETRRRRQLSRNLLVPRRSKNGKATSTAGQIARSCCFNLPNRCFYFVPVTPDGLLAEWDDPPPVDFGCDSFILTSTACGAEMLSLDPFHGTLTVYENCLDNAVASDEGMMEQAMLEAANLIDGNRENPSDDDELSDEHIAGAVFDQRVYRNHNITQYKKPPFQMLFRLEDDIDLEACFPQENDNSRHNGIPQHFNTSPPEIEVGYHGIDSKCIFKDNRIVGNMVAVGRMVTKETRSRFPNANNNNNNNNNRQRNEPLVCTELISWTRQNDDAIAGKHPRNQQYGGRQICRFPWSFKSIDLCATHNRVYVSFDALDGPLSRRIDTDRASTLCSSTVVVYPMVPYPHSATRRYPTRKSKRKCSFQEPEFFIRCQSEISALAVDPTGDFLLVGTTNGTCEVWSIVSGCHGATTGKRAAAINMKSSISNAFVGANADATERTNGSAMDHDLDDSTRMRRTLLTILNRPKIVSFHHPSHLPLSTCGFVTLQHSSSDGSSLLLWRKNDDPLPDDGDIYKIVSMINLPLSGTTRSPRVFFDGRRILVFGQDHIGLIILVYHVLSSYEDSHLFQETTIKEENSGGVFNLTSPSRVRFANRIRHAALGGLEYYDSIHMTCNDRFIVVNTKTGNLLSDSTLPFQEGLLVIDLQD